jgi:hypothetical protein
MAQRTDAYLKAIKQIHELRGKPFAPHDVVGVSDTTKRRVFEVFLMLKMLVKFPRAYNHKFYQTTKQWTTDVEAVQIYELTQTMRKPYGYKEKEDTTDVDFFKRKA